MEIRLISQVGYRTVNTEQRITVLKDLPNASIRINDLINCVPHLCPHSTTELFANSGINVFSKERKKERKRVILKILCCSMLQSKAKKMVYI